MSMTMDQDKIKALALELARDVKTLEDLSRLSAQLTKITVEAALGAEMEAHLHIHHGQTLAYLLAMGISKVSRCDSIVLH